jgi:benzoyl-CoA-dihydrodiol lyase
VVPPSAWERTIAERAQQFAARSDRPSDSAGIALTPLDRVFSDAAVTYSHVRVDLDRPARRATITIAGPSAPLPTNLSEIHAAGAAFWPLAMARELDDAILHLRANEPELGVIVLRTEGAEADVLAADALLESHAQDWFVREIRLYLKRTLKRLDMTSRSLIALIEPGSCFVGTLAELAFAADRAIMLDGARGGDNRGPAAMQLTAMNFGPYPMGNGLTRLATRFFGEPESVTGAQATIGTSLDSEAAEAHGLVTAIFDDTDYDDEVRLMLEERASFSPDALTAMEANLRYAGPETMETRIFGRLTAWQNWVFQRANAVGDEGALKRYGSGIKPAYNFNRV